MKSLILTIVMFLVLSNIGYSQTQNVIEKDEQSVALRPVPATPPAAIGNENSSKELKQAVAVKPKPAQENGSQFSNDTNKVWINKEINGQGATPPANEFDNRATSDPNFTTIKFEKAEKGK